MKAKPLSQPPRTQPPSSAGAGHPLPPKVKAGRNQCSCEILILPDGSLITHNLTPAVADLLKEVLHV